MVSSKLQPCLEEAWPVILQAVVLDAAPGEPIANGSSATEDKSESPFISEYRMVVLRAEEFHFLWGFSLLVLFQGQGTASDELVIPVGSVKSKFSGDLTVEDESSLASKTYETILPILQFLSMERFFSTGYLTMDICRELLQVNSSSLKILPYIYFYCSNEAFIACYFSLLNKVDDIDSLRVLRLSLFILSIL